MSLSQLEEWFDAFRQFGYIPGFIMLYLRAIVPVLPLTFVRRAINTCVWIVSRYNYQLARYRLRYFYCFLICKKFVNTIRMKKLKVESLFKG